MCVGFFLGGWVGRGYLNVTNIIFSKKSLVCSFFGGVGREGVFKCDQYNL